jgi:hypothetical protein
LLDHLRCCSDDGKGNIPLTNFALRRIREGDEKTSGAFNDADVMDQKAIVEANGSIGFDQNFVGWTILTPVIFMLIQPKCHGFYPVSDSFYGPSFLRVSGEKCNDGKKTYDGHGEPDDAVRGSP